MASLSPCLAPKKNGATTLEQYFRQDPDYQNIGAEEVIKFHRFFTQDQLTQGFPWHPLKPPELDSRRERISDLEALQRLIEGKPIELEPTRVIRIDRSAAKLAEAAAVETSFSSSARVAANITNANPGARTMTRETNNGARIYISNPSYLKLLYHLHSGDLPENPTNILTKAAKNLSYFTAGSKDSNYPWRFHSTTRHPWGIFKATVKRALKHGIWFGVVGAVGGAIIGGPVGVAMGFSSPMAKALVAFGSAAAVWGGIHGAKRPLRSQNGRPYDEITVLEKLLKNEPVYFQRVCLQTVEPPILGPFSWHDDYGKPNLIHNTDELSLFAKLQMDVDHNVSADEQRQRLVLSAWKDKN